MNLPVPTGSIGAVNSGHAFHLINYWPFVILEGTWALVAVVALFKK